MLINKKEDAIVKRLLAVLLTLQMLTFYWPNSCACAEEAKQKIFRSGDFE